jgi:hypothetical protein
MANHARWGGEHVPWEDPRRRDPLSAAVRRLPLPAQIPKPRAPHSSPTEPAQAYRSSPARSSRKAVRSPSSSTG